MVSIAIILVAVLIAAIWLFIEFKRFRHKMVAVFLILLILFTYISFSSVIKGKNLDLKTFNGVKEAGKLYFLWLGNIFNNMKVVTSNAINMSWSVNDTSNASKTVDTTSKTTS
jgi:hypothetical protein